MLNIDEEGNAIMPFYMDDEAHKVRYSIQDELGNLQQETNQR